MQHNSSSSKDTKGITWKFGHEFRFSTNCLRMRKPKIARDRRISSEFFAQNNFKDTKNWHGKKIVIENFGIVRAKLPIFGHSIRRKSEQFSRYWHLFRAKYVFNWFLSFLHSFFIFFCCCCFFVAKHTKAISKQRLAEMVPVWCACACAAHSHTTISKY